MTQDNLTAVMTVESAGGRSKTHSERMKEMRGLHLKIKNPEEYCCWNKKTPKL